MARILIADDEADMVTGLRDNLQFEGYEVVVASGLQPGMQVVVAGVHVLSPGQKVTIYKEKVALVQIERPQSAIKSGANSSLPMPLPMSAAAASK